MKGNVIDFGFYRTPEHTNTRTEFMVSVTGRSGSHFYRKAHVNAEELAALDALLSKRREAGDILTYSFESLIPYNFAQMALWIESFKAAQQSGMFPEPEHTTESNGLFGGN